MFRLGDKVKWTSQANGSFKTKQGEIVEVVPECYWPDRDRFLSLFKHSGVGAPRDHESYVVRVGKKFYWPRVSQLYHDYYPPVEHNTGGDEVVEAG